MKFQLNDKELSNIKEIKDAFKIIFNKDSEFQYCFTESSMGVACIIKEIKTGLEYNITDYDSW